MKPGFCDDQGTASGFYLNSLSHTHTHYLSVIYSSFLLMSIDFVKADSVTILESTPNLNKGTLKFLLSYHKEEINIIKPKFNIETMAPEKLLLLTSLFSI